MASTTHISTSFSHRLHNYALEQAAALRRLQRNRDVSNNHTTLLPANFRLYLIFLYDSDNASAPPSPPRGTSQAHPPPSLGRDLILGSTKA